MDNESKQAEKAKRNRLLLYTAIAAIVALIFIYFSENSRLFPNVDKEIAEMEVERFVPDEENAAIIYEQLLAVFDENDFNYKITGIDIRGEEYSKGWKSEDYPQAAEWLEGQEETIAKLLEASKRERCYYPFETDIDSRIRPLRNFRYWAFLLVFSANNDAGEGRIEEAIEKTRGALQTGKHLQEQIFITEYMVGIAIDAITLNNLKMLLVESDIEEEELEMIEQLPIPTTNDWESKCAELNKVEGLYALKKGNVITALFMKKSVSEAIERIGEVYSRVLSDRRAVHIIIELKKYKEREGSWPTGLEEIEGNLDAEIFIDPQNGGEFVYKVTNEGFTLHSKGFDNINEGGDMGDDWRIWPRK